MKDNRAVTYSLLAHVRNTGTLMKGPIDAFVPLIKRILHILNQRGVFKGKSILEIQKLSKEIYSIDFPLPVLKTILNKIAIEVNTKDSINFEIFQDNSFILKDFFFEDFEEKIQESKRDVETIEKLFIELLAVNFFAHKKLPAASNLLIKISSLPPEDKVKVPAPGSKSTVP